MEQKLTIAETFVGCGGSHIGFKDNFETVFVNDNWDDALNTLKLNHPELHENKVILEDINDFSKKDVCKKFNIKKGDLSLLIGGVVCKGFSMAGVRNPYDERNYLYISQLRLVEKLLPKVSIIENVPGMLNMKILAKDKLAPMSKSISIKLNDDITELCKEIDSTVIEQKNNTGKIIAINKKLSINENEETKMEKEQLEKEKNIIAKTRKEQDKILEKYKYSVVEDIEEKYKELGYKVYKKKLKVSNYGGYTNRERLIIVAVRNDIKKEWNYPTILNDNNDNNIPNLLTVKDAFNLIDYDNVNHAKNDPDNIPMNHKASTIEKFKNISANNKSNGFSSRGTSNRLDYNKPSPTLVPGHSSFHIHPEEHRSITVREGATITGFPINYRFVGSHSSRCTQIGNAIPFQLANVLSNSVKDLLL